jgi:predicted GIY-YIG superfamily endonuclease
MDKRDTNKYILKNGNKIMYVGITDDPSRREYEHRRDKEFQKMMVVGRKVSRKSAEDWETKRIKQYQQNHNGEVPPLNKTQNGK